MKAQLQSLKGRRRMASSSTATTLVVLCSSLTNKCKISSHSQNPLSFPLPSTNKPSPFSNPCFGSLSKLSSSRIPSRRPAFLPVPKFSETDAPVIEAEPVAPEPEPEPEAEPVQIVDVAVEEPKREQIFAVVMIGSRQYIVIPGRYIYVQRLKGAKVNDKIILNKVLLVGTKSSTYIGKPVVTNAAVHAIVEEQGLDDKVIVFKYKKKKNYRRNIGHRQPNTRIRITSITGYEEYPAVTLES